MKKRYIVTFCPNQLIYKVTLCVTERNSNSPLLRFNSIKL